jgi:hypothetical protein
MCTEMDQEAEDYLEAWRESLRESLLYFRRENVQSRERDTVTDFLANIIHDLDEEQILSSESDPPDVLYRDAKFEVKEILDPGRRRGDEYRALLERAEAATDPDESFSDFTPKELTPLETGAMVLEKLEELERKYDPAFVRSVDLLVYVNLLEHFYKPGPMPAAEEFESFGWRSVSAVTGRCSFVFFASDTAPDFLKHRLGQVCERQAHT